MEAPYCGNGALTLVAMPGFESIAQLVKQKVESMHEADSDKKFTPVDVVFPIFGQRASGEPYLRLGKDHIGGHDCVVITSGPGTYEMLMQLYIVLKYLKGRHAQRIGIVCGYFPLSRSDKDEGSLEFAMMRPIMDLIMEGSEGKLVRIISADLHSPQVVAAAPIGLLLEVSLVRRLLTRTIEEARKETDKICLALPDDGAANRIKGAMEEVQDKLQVQLATVFGAKRRISSRSSEIKQLFGDLHLLRDATVICLDDEIATGGTNINAATSLKKEYGAKQVWAAVTHGVMCGEAPQLFALPKCPVDRIYAMDTIPFDCRPHLTPLIASNKLIVISWWEDLSWIVYHHHWEKSIREIR